MAEGRDRRPGRIHPQWWGGQHDHRFRLHRGRSRTLTRSAKEDSEEQKRTRGEERATVGTDQRVASAGVALGHNEAASEGLELLSTASVDCSQVVIGNLSCTVELADQATSEVIITAGDGALTGQ